MLAHALLLCAWLGAQDIARTLETAAGHVVLPPGTFEIGAEIKLPAGARGLSIRGDGTVLRASARFQGRALISCRDCRQVSIMGLTLDGNRSALERRAGVPASWQTFASVSFNNGLLFENARGVRIERVAVREIPGFAILAAQSSGVRIERVSVRDSGSRNALGRNNTTGGILFEEGCEGFAVIGSSFENIRGNALWTHSRYQSPRNRAGTILGNSFIGIGRDAIQVGHAVAVNVTGNRGSRIGYPIEDVDVEGGGIPVGIDTAGNVEACSYAGNIFEEWNGKCIDLDGFHDGSVTGNACVNRGRAADYPFGQFAIVMNNANIDMHSKNVRIENNRISGAKFGAIFVIGSGHRIAHNRLDRINLSHCGGSAAASGCSVAGFPRLLESGIYLASHAERPDAASGDVIEHNRIAGWKMASRCVAAGPGVSLKDNTVSDNICLDESK